MIDSGKKTRLRILIQNAESHLFTILKSHNWNYDYTKHENGEYLKIKIKRMNRTFTFAFLYSSAIDNRIYKELDKKVDHIFTMGESHKIDQYAYGISTNISHRGKFKDVLQEWNEKASDGTYLDKDEQRISKKEVRPDSIRLVSEKPIDAVWLRLNQYESLAISKKLIEEKFKASGASLSEGESESRGQGVSFSLRNAKDYYKSSNISTSQKILNLYYGTMSFCFAEILSSPGKFKKLEAIEERTKFGHGLYTIDNEDGVLSDLTIGLVSNGFFSTYLSFLGHSLDDVPNKKPRNKSAMEALDKNYIVNFVSLISRIPEIGDLFQEVFPSKPGFGSVHHKSAVSHQFGETNPEWTYLEILDVSGRLFKEDISKLSAGLSEITENNGEKDGRSYSALLKHPGSLLFWDSLNTHQSPFISSHYLISPIFKDVVEYRAICTTILYTLSIIVRYRPSLWRRIIEGDLDKVKVMIESFLEVVERVLPQQYLSEILGQKVHVSTPGSFF